ncbi:MAG: hypothetical protein V9G15_02080 [Dermatophilaceae bacterium]|nr:hypothetical protein [Actinomycetales bacterium]
MPGSELPARTRLARVTAYTATAGRGRVSERPNPATLSVDAGGSKASLAHEASHE